MFAFGPFCHVMCCASVYYHNALYRIDPGRAIEGTMDFAKFFLLPVSAVFFDIYILLEWMSIIENNTKLSNNNKFILKNSLPPSTMRTVRRNIIWEQS